MEYKICNITNAKDFIRLYLEIPYYHLSEEDFNFIEWYGTGDIKATTGHIKEELTTLAGIYRYFLKHCNKGIKFLKEKDNEIYWYKGGLNNGI